MYMNSVSMQLLLTLYMPTLCTKCFHAVIVNFVHFLLSVINFMCMYSVNSVHMHLLLTLFTPTVCTFPPFSHKLYVHAQYEQRSHTFVVSFVHAYCVHTFCFPSLTTFTAPFL